MPMDGCQQPCGLRLAEKTARKVARMHGTPVYFWKNGKVVAEKP